MLKIRILTLSFLKICNLFAWRLDRVATDFDAVNDYLLGSLLTS